MVHPQLIVDFFNVGFQVVYWMILIRVVMSWIRIDPYNPVAQFVRGATDPLLEPIRRYMPQGMMLDLSPLVALILVRLLQSVFMSVLIQILR